MRVIARKGMAAATMQEIAEEAGVAKGTIYLYFRDRDELVEKTFETAIDELHKRVDAARASGETFEEKFRAVIAAELALQPRAATVLWATDDDVLAGTRPDLMLLDVVLPGMSGIDLCRRVRSADGINEPWDPDLPIIMLSAKAEHTDRVRGLSRGADDYVTKPFHYP